jgi:hypothetical protein
LIFLCTLCHLYIRVVNTDQQFVVFIVNCSKRGTSERLEWIVVLFKLVNEFHDLKDRGLHLGSLFETSRRLMRDIPPGLYLRSP